MPVLSKIAFLCDEFRVPSPAQQLLDRLLMGYASDGVIRPAAARTVSIFANGSADADLIKRSKDFKAVLADNAAAAMQGADAVIVVSKNAGAIANETLIETALRQLPRNGACFVYGTPGNSTKRAEEFIALARSRDIALLAGTPLPLAWRLPQVELPRDARVAEALVVVQGAWPIAELNGLESLLPIIERRRGGESGVRQIRRFEGEQVWHAGEKKPWSWPLLACALSRSDSPQGDAVRDGRTEDLVRLGLVQKLARNPRAWVMEHRDGVRSTILVLDGVVADINFAVRTKEGTTISAQVLRGPPPAEQHFSRLAEAVEGFLRTKQAPWRIERNVLVAGLLEVFGQERARAAKNADRRPA